MEYRFFKAEDYPMLKKWWIQWEWGAPPLPALPQNGLIVSNGGVDVAAAFLYKTDSSFCLIEWFISNKEAPRELRKGSIDFLISNMVRLAKCLKYEIAFSSVKPSVLEKRLKKKGFLADSNMINLTINLRSI